MLRLVLVLATFFLYPQALRANGSYEVFFNVTADRFEYFIYGKDGKTSLQMSGGNLGTLTLEEITQKEEDDREELTNEAQGAVNPRSCAHAFRHLEKLESLDRSIPAWAEPFLQECDGAHGVTRNNHISFLPETEIR